PFQETRETGGATTMKKLATSLGILSILALSSASYATSVKDLINANGCFACHSVDTKMVGPSFKMVADKYRGQKGADEMLAKKIIAGGNGNWNDVTGGVMMPPHPGLSMDQAEAIAKWVLATK
ncbi:MAG: c-type cytochrome, partial [Leptospirillia bacterium]